MHVRVGAIGQNLIFYPLAVDVIELDGTSQDMQKKAEVVAQNIYRDAQSWLMGSN